MKILAADYSTSRPSLAWLVDGELRASVRWIVESRRDQSFFQQLSTFLEQHEIQVAELDALAFGRGPGNFSGLRASQAALQGLALPHKTPLVAVSSGAALAWDYLQGCGEPSQHVAVVGDARRGTLWFGLFDADEGKLRCNHDWDVVPVESHADILCRDASTRVLSSECERVRPLIDLSVEPAFPAAEWVGHLAIEQLEGRMDREPLLPIYLHPAVAPPA